MAKTNRLRVALENCGFRNLSNAKRRFQKRARSDEDRQAVRDKIVAAAQQLFNITPVNDVTMRMIAEETGYSAGTIYQYFPNKNALIVFIKREALSRINKKLMSLAKKCADPRQRLEHLMSAYLRFWQNNEESFKFIFALDHGVEGRRLKDGRLIGESDEARETFLVFHEAVTEFFVCQSVQLTKKETYFLTSTLMAASHGALTLPLGASSAKMPPSQDMSAALMTAILDSWSNAAKSGLSHKLTSGLSSG